MSKIRQNKDGTVTINGRIYTHKHKTRHERGGFARVLDIDSPSIHIAVVTHPYSEERICLPYKSEFEMRDSGWIELKPQIKETGK